MAVGNVQRNGQRPDGSTVLIATADPRYSKMRGMLDVAKPQIAQIVCRAMSPDDLTRLCLNATCKSPDLLKCMEDQRGIASIGLALMKAAAMNLRPDGRNGHLIPFWNNKGFMECQFFPDYKGLVKLICLSPKVATVNGAAVRENDLFEFEYGSNEFVRFVPAKANRGKLIATFAYYKTPTNQTCFRVLWAEEVLKRRSSAKTQAIWNAWEEEMWTKTGLHHLAKVAPLGEDFERAISIDELDESGVLTEEDLRNASLGRIGDSSATEKEGDDSPKTEVDEWANA